MAYITAGEYRELAAALDRAAVDAIPANGTITEQIACGIMSQIAEHLRDNPTAKLSDKDAAFLRYQIAICLDLLQS